MVRMKVGITGGAGNIGRRLVQRLGHRYDFTLFDRSVVEAIDMWPIVPVDLSRPEELAGRFEGLDAIVHLAAAHRGDPTFAAVVEHNIMGTFHLMEEARRAGVAKIVFASTNHVQNGLAVGNLRNMGAVSPEFLASGRTLSTRDAPAPDSFYGVSKLCCEELGRYYAEYLRCIAFVALRIGWSAPADPAEAPIRKIMASRDVEMHYRALFMSERDTAELFHRALQTDLRFFIGYGTSANPVRIFDLADTTEQIGYCPQDNSAAYFDAALAALAARQPAG